MPLLQQFLACTGRAECLCARRFQVARQIVNIVRAPAVEIGARLDVAIYVVRDRGVACRRAWLIRTRIFRHAMKHLEFDRGRADRCAPRAVVSEGIFLRTPCVLRRLGPLVLAIRIRRESTVRLVDDAGQRPGIVQPARVRGLVV